jgi:Flp pilus assembly protein TadG
LRFLFVRDERGSASIEFVLLAIPLFIPLFIYMNSFAGVSGDQETLRTLARESARAFVTSVDDKTAFAVSQSVINEGGKLLGYQNPTHQIQMNISCSHKPCISPDSEIVVTLTLPDRDIEVSAIEYVTPWA